MECTMADRLFGICILAISLAYGVIAFTIIKAPFQYDPLGPESWPRILSIVAAFCSLYIIIKPDVKRIGVAGHTLLRVAIVVVMLAAYAYFFESAGFILATTVFCCLFSRLFGARLWEAVLFGIASGVFGHILCVVLLDLNLPKGVLAPIL
jgi:putative tricarboxylic transport membrane protein